jgi:DNA primase catalytic subunit
MNTPSILWVYRFPSLKMNHVIVVYSGTRDATGYHYHVYDPNYRDRFSHFDYDPKTRIFSFQRVYFFKGGPVTARSIYRGLLQ